MHQISPAELRQWQNENRRMELVDVREAVERQLFQIGGRHLPMQEVWAARESLPTDVPVVVYCEKGIRSVIVIQRLEAAGFTNLYNLAGGMAAWKATLGK